MQDRFKFRVWHITEKRMLYEDSEILNNRKQYPFEEWWGSEENFALNGLKNVFLKFPKVYTLMQCTGIKDKNGKLIYEGDICRNANTDEIVSVDWHGTFASFVWSKPKYAKIYDFGELFRAYDYYEVIGNIYENPELLESN